MKAENGQIRRGLQKSSFVKGKIMKYLIVTIGYLLFTAGWGFILSVVFDFMFIGLSGESLSTTKLLWTPTFLIIAFMGQRLIESDDEEE